MTRRHGFLRAGFVLPMSLVATFITMMIVAASATYCTTQFRTSNLYLSRTRCRLAAQSAIELTKLEISRRCSGQAIGIPDPTGENYNVADLSSLAAVVKAETIKEDFLRKIPGYGPDMKVYVDIKAGNGINRIYSTAEHTSGGRVTTVTLQENVKIPLSDANILLYAYFANHDGHLTSQYMTVNGDIRTNGKFSLTGVEVNGFVIATNGVDIAENDKWRWPWYDDKDVTIRTAKSYNDTYRGTAYAKVRPTDPLNAEARATNANLPESEWEGGFDPVDGTTTTTKKKKYPSSWWEWLFGGGGEEEEVVTTVSSTQKITTDLQTVSGENVVTPNATVLYMPRIVRDSEPESFPDQHLQAYKDHAAGTVNSRGQNGGTLVCSNCFYNTSTKSNEQLSVQLMMSWTETKTSKGGWIKYEKDETEENPVTDASKIVNNDNLIPNASTPIYRVITTSRYNSLSKSEQEKYLQLVWDHGEAPNKGKMGTISDGLVKDSNSAGEGKVVLKDESLGFGESWMIDTDSLDRLVKNYRAQQRASSSISVSDDEVNFTIDGWVSHSCAKEYSTNEDKKWVSTSRNSPGATWDRTRGWGRWETSYTYTYTGHYYSKLPVGYIQMNVSTREVDGAPILTPSYVDLNWTAPTTRKLVAVRSVALHTFYDTKSGGGRIKIDKDSLAGYSNNGTGSSFNGKFYLNSDLDNVASALKTKYGYSIDKSEVQAAGNGWQYRGKPQSYYSSTYYYGSAVSGYLKVELYGEYRAGEIQSYDEEYSFVSSKPSDSDEGSGASDGKTVVEEHYVPLHKYKESPTYTEQKSGKWRQLQYGYNSVSGYIKSSFDGQSNMFMLSGDFDKIVREINEDTWEDVYRLDDDTLEDFPRDNGWTLTYDSKYWYNTDIAGYLAIRVVRTYNTYTRKDSYSVESGYSLTAGSGAATGGTDADYYNYWSDIEKNLINSKLIPVYERTTTTIGSKDPKKWIDIGKTLYNGGYYNSRTTSDEYNRFFRPDHLQNVADAYAREYNNADLSRKIVDLFADSNGDGAKNGWVANYKSGCYSREIIGYIQLTISSTPTKDHELVIGYSYLSIAGGDIKETIEHKKGDNKEWDPDMVVPMDIRHDNEPVVRQLRRIYVKGGYKIDDAASTIHAKPDDADLVLTRETRLSSGSTTADLRPFREDAQVQCNKNTPQFGGRYLDQGAVILIGTWDYPICIDGPVVFESDVIIRGFVSGRGTIYSGRNIHIIGDICYKNPPFWPYSGGVEPDTKGKDLLMLVSRGSIVVGNYVSDELWTADNGVIKGNYIRHTKNTDDGLNRYYTAKDYTQEDTDYRKVKYDKSGQRLTEDRVKYFESVVGDYVFISENNSDNSSPSGSSFTKNGSDCRFSQHWDCNPYYNQNNSYKVYASYQCTAIEAYANSKNWSASLRAGPGGKSFDDIWRDSSFHTYCRTKYAKSYSQTRSGWWSGTLPCLGYIQAINAVMYSSGGIFGVVGGYKTPININGAIIGQDEALCPFARNRRRTWWGSQSEDLRLTINWDIRLNKKSGDAKKNQDKGDIGAPESSSSDGEFKAYQTISWQEVPDSFNEEYHATP